VIALLLWIGSIAILAAQLIAIGTILNYVAGVPFAWGCVIGGLVVCVYFSAGGLLTSAWVNVVQLTVKMAGFAIALPLALKAVGGWNGLTAIGTDRALYWTFWRTDVALGYLFAFAPAFVISPGLLQKVFGARDDRAVRLGVGWNAVGLALYAVVPALLGIAARGLFPELADSQQALPAILVRALPPLVGAIGLAAVFSAEVSAADAVLLMLTTSLSQDLYKRYVAPQASDAQVLRIARLATIASSTLGVGLAVASRSIVDVLTIFYTLMSVSLFVPVVGGLFVRRTTTASALAAIISGVAAMLVNHVATGGRGWGMVTPALGGLVAALVAWTTALLFAPDSTRGGECMETLFRLDGKVTPSSAADRGSARRSVGVVAHGATVVARCKRAAAEAVAGRLRTPAPRRSIFAIANMCSRHSTASSRSTVDSTSFCTPLSTFGNGFSIIRSMNSTVWWTSTCAAVSTCC
jgi:SSS family solute:Na+ symporter